MDILYVGTLPPHNGGSAIVGYQVLSGLALKGHRVRAIAPITSGTAQLGEQFAARYPEINVRWFELPFYNNSPDRPMSEAYKEAEDLEIVSAFRAAISKQRPEVVVIGRETFAWQLPTMAEELDIPSLLIVHGAGLFGMLHSFSAKDRAHLLEQFEKVDLVVTVARHLDSSMQQLGLPEPLHIANPVDLSRFFPAPKEARLMERLEISPEHLVLAHISNLKSLKRTSDIVASACDVVRSLPRAVYLIVGDGPCKEQMILECREAGLLDHFRFVGWIEHGEVAKYVNLADIVLLPSESEALALVCLETQACGRTLIASDIPASREVIVDGQTGLLFRMSDVEDLTKKTLLAANDGELRERVGMASLKSVQRNALSHCVDAYEGALRQAVQKHWASS